MYNQQQQANSSPQDGKPVVMIAVDRLDPNPWNPNRMSKAAFNEYVAEVRHLGRLPKPITCRPVGDRYEIIDGEHGWRAAQEVELAEVPCEVMADADDFEAMRQTFKRNRGGKDNPVLLGQMFRQMMREQELSIRGLAREINISEATIRNNLAYAKAAEVRTSFAGEDRQAEIAKISKREIELYLKLPDAIRNKWLDAGADFDEFDISNDLDECEMAESIMAAGLADFVVPKLMRFRQSLAYLLELAQWRSAHGKVARINEFLRPVAELHLPVSTLEELPLCADTEQIVVLLAPEEWQRILSCACDRAVGTRARIASIQSAVYLALCRKGVDIEAVRGPEVAGAWQLLQEAPAFIRDANHLPLDEKMQLATIRADASEPMVLRAKEMTVEYLRRRRELRDVKEAKEDSVEGTDYGNKLDEVFDKCLLNLHRGERVARQQRLFADPEKLLQAVLQKLTASETLEKEQVHGRSATELLAERLSDLDWPEVALLATLVLRSDETDDAVVRWLESVKESLGFVQAAS